MWRMLFVLPVLFLLPFVVNLGSWLERSARGPDKQLEIDSAYLRVLPWRIKAKGLSFREGDPEVSEVSLRAEQVEIPFSPLALLRNEYSFGQIRVNGLTVELTEGDKDGVPTESKPRKIKISGVTIEDSNFVYRRRYKGRDATIKLGGIKRALTALDSEDRGLRTVGKVQARLEKSGQVELNLTAVVFAAEPDVQVDLRVAEFPLAEVNEYFFPSDAIKLSGKLHEGKAAVNVTGASLKSEVSVVYQGLDVIFSANRERSGATAFFSNLLRGLKIDDQNTTEPRYDQKRTAALQRKKGESIVSFILRGMKEAALEVAST